MSTDTKPTNPKDAIAGSKLQLGLVPDVARIALALAFTEGATKYGRFNWRIAGVSASVYRNAMERHMVKWWNGQDKDPTTQVHHLANLMACCAIILDAELYGLLNDDRPPAPNRDAMADAVDAAEATTRFLKKLFENFKPRQFVLGDTAESYAAELAAQMNATADAIIRDITGDNVPAGTVDAVAEATAHEALAELAGDGRGHGADAVAEPPAAPLFCDHPMCYGNPGHSGPHSDYEGVNLPG
jgi:hypothetical protein